ncbi:hypothetical protein CG018_00220 [Gemella sp. ND 6198]|uniref:hypothetical protein n=1 Tax=Gemella sp. ND 6198 TaxID=2040624 RepID=UPI000E0CBF27|nr:hypothetical protein [Gemella sp. ND 6198]AXI25987.1 hypothetical protein CG018_00220 [Gemella sp. ND 6198]
MKYKLILPCLVCLGFASINSETVHADFYTDYNTSVLDTMLKKNIFDTDIFQKTLKYSPPKINTNITTQITDELDYTAELLDYNKNSYNYLIFYSSGDEKNPTELFRIAINKTGTGKIKDHNLLNKLKPNTKFFLKVMSFNIDNNGNIGEVKYSKSSDYYYTKKTIHLAVMEDEKTVKNKNITLINLPTKDEIQINPYELQQHYRTDKYYTYNNAKVVVDDKETLLNGNILTIPYNAEKIVINLVKNKDNWRNVKVEFPTEYKNENKEYSAKKNTPLSEFFKNNNLKNNFEKNGNYTFRGYYLDDKEVNTSNDDEITNNITIKAKFNTKLILDNGKSTKEQNLVTGEKLEKIDNSFFYKEKYHIVSYSLYKKNGEKIKDITSLADETVDESIVIKANYEENTNIVSVRQDDYNKRFGKVSDDIKDADIKWSQTKKIGDLLKKLREKVKPNSGYKVVFRINKKVVDESSYIDKDIVLEIYFKKIEEEWVNVKFIGKGIDKFLSDGQEVLYNSRIDSAVNLPTATGETEREFLGWQANRDYTVLDENSNKIQVSKNKLLQTNELGAVIAEKGKNLEFTAIYRKIFNIEFLKTQTGSVELSKANQNILKVDEFDSIGMATKDNKILVLPKSHYNLSYFTANKNVKISTESGYKEIFAGEKIAEKELYNIVPTSDLKITPIFEFSLFSKTVDDIITSSKIKSIDEALILELESTENIRRILGPLYYLR